MEQATQVAMQVTGLVILAMLSSAVARVNFAAAAPLAATDPRLSMLSLSHLHPAILLGYFFGHYPSDRLANSVGSARVPATSAIFWSFVTLAHAAVSLIPSDAELAVLAVLRFAVGGRRRWAAASPALAATRSQLLPVKLRARVLSTACCVHPPPQCAHV
jgi:hypothetical protein